MNTKEKIKVMQAYLDGKIIEYRLSDESSYHLIDREKEVNWDWGHVEYRVKPKPMTVYMKKCDDYTMKFVCWAYSPIPDYDKDPNMVKFVEKM